MAARSKSNFKITGWDEAPYDEFEDGGKLTKASVTAEFSGDIAGESTVEWLMCYRPDQTADFVGLQRIVGTLGGRSGSFVLAHPAGTFDGTAATCEVSVVEGSGTGELSGLRGRGQFAAPHGGEPSIELDYELD